jgi:hypothetical protein
MLYHAYEMRRRITASLYRLAALGMEALDLFRSRSGRLRTSVPAGCFRKRC